jgi:hypothetical protein
MHFDANAMREDQKMDDGVGDRRRADFTFDRCRYARQSSDLPGRLIVD